MIIHQDVDISEYEIIFKNPQKYSEKFTFVPIKIKYLNTLDNYLQTPLLFSPYGSQVTLNNKIIVDLSFINENNDISVKKFKNNLLKIQEAINKRYTNYNIVKFLDDKNSFRLRITENSKLFDDLKNEIDEIPSSTYGNYIIQLEGLWIFDKDIYYQWKILQSKIQIPIYLKDYAFIEKVEVNDKYDKMIKMGVPINAVNQQKILDGKIPVAPPPPPPSFKSKPSIQKITANDLQSVVLKKRTHKQIKKHKTSSFEPPSLEEIRNKLSSLRKTK